MAKHANWNSRDWVAECIAALDAHGLVDCGFCHFQSELLPVMRQASALTAHSGRPAVVDFYEFEGSV